MPLLEGTTNQILEAVMDGSSSLSGKPVVNVYHYLCNTAVPTPNKTALRNSFKSQMCDIVLTMLHSTYTMNRIRVRFLDNVLDPYLDTAYTDTGAFTGDAVSTCYCIFMRLETGVRGKPFRGGKHYSPLDEILIRGDRIQRTMGALPASVGNVSLALAASLSDGTNAYAPTIVSKSRSVTPIGTGGIWCEAVNRVVIDDTLGTLRHRRERTVIA